jgi:hypothetical protein
MNAPSDDLYNTLVAFYGAKIWGVIKRVYNFESVTSSQNAVRVQGFQIGWSKFTTSNLLAAILNSQFFQPILYKIKTEE